MMKKNLILFFILLFSFSALADEKVCIYVNGSAIEPGSRHEFVTVERGDKVIDTYGYYPEHVPSYSGVAFIRNHNQVLSDQRLFELHGRFAVQERFCRPIANKLKQYDLRWFAREYAKAYLQKYPTYNALSRNCLTFAKLAYSQITGDKIPYGITPTGIATMIDKAHNQGATTLSQMKR